jgi:hypothetical protein
MGNVLGAYLAAMLYDTVGPALLATLGADQFQSTLDINTRVAGALWVCGFEVSSRTAGAQAPRRSGREGWGTLDVQPRSRVP